MMGADGTKTVRAELVEAPHFLSHPGKGEGFDWLSPNGWVAP